MRPLPFAFFAALLFLAPVPAAQAVDHTRHDLVIASKTGEHTFQVEIAADERTRTFGLMFRREMPADQGMLFDFGSEQPVSFWMRNTYISLDMLFIKADGTIELIAERTTPLSERGVPSKGPVRYVLEINGGVSETLGIAPGDTASGPALASRQ